MQLHITTQVEEAIDYCLSGNQICHMVIKNNQGFFMILRTCDFSDKLSTLPIIQQVVGVATIASNVCKIIQDLYRYAIEYDTTMDERIIVIDNEIVEVNRFDSCIPNHFITKFAMKELPFIRFTNKDWWPYLNAINNLSAMIVECWSVPLSNDNQSDLGSTLAQNVDSLADKALNKITQFLETERESCENDKGKLLHHIKYIGIGILRCIPVVGTIYSVVIWRKHKDSGQSARSVKNDIFSRIESGVKNLFYSGYTQVPLDTK